MAPKQAPIPEPPPQAVLDDRLCAAIDLLERLAGDWSLLDGLPSEDRARLHRAVARLSIPEPGASRKRARRAARQERATRLGEEDAVLDRTGIRALRRRAVVITPNPPSPPVLEDGRPIESSNSGSSRDEFDNGQTVSGSAVVGRHCYICKAVYSRIHHFYDQLCPACADFNFAARTELADLGGRVALLTGGRVKIGYQAGLKLLRCGAHLIVTTRFPRNAAMRYAAEHDFREWGDRLRIVGLDLRHVPSVEAFCGDLLAAAGRLDFIINNACQTVRRPPDFYAHMMAGERAAAAAMSADTRRLLRGEPREERVGGHGGSPLRRGDGATHLETRMAVGSTAAELSQVALLPEELLARPDVFPAGRVDGDLQQVDLRGHNSWRMLLADVPTVELLEVHLVNAVAPFLLNARLKPLMARTPGREKHIVNVSAMEGQFYRSGKTTRHPHTNMAKAALNMMTRTSAADYHNDGIHMNSVDTGWVTDEDPAPIAARKVAEQRFHPPLDVVDGGARIVAPIVSGFNTGVHVWGQFLKDYRPTAW